MRQSNLVAILLVLVLCFSLQAGDEKMVMKKGQCPITTQSDKAMDYFLTGRDLAEKLRGQEALVWFKKAIQEDPDFAMAHLNLALVQPTFKEFFASFGKAKDIVMVNKVSEGERLWILGVEAGAINGDPVRQRELYTKLVKKYPNDERAHNLLATHYFGQQNFKKAIEAFENTIKINPNFPNSYNMLGYAYQAIEDYDNAEKSFQTYIKLIPDDPNPYDSYAELLMKMGKYDASINNYKKALKTHPDFVFSHVGIASNLNYKGEHAEAREQLRKMYKDAKNDGQRRTALTAMAVSFVDEGNLDLAIEQLRKQHDIAKNINDVAAMSADLVLIGNVHLEANRPTEAQQAFNTALEIVEGSNLSTEVKNQTNLAHLYNMSRVHIARGNIDEATALATQYTRRVEDNQNANQIRLAHELHGMIALKTGEYDTANDHLMKANQQNPYTFFRMAQCHEGKGDWQKAKELYQKAATFNINNSMLYSYVRTKAKQKLGSM